LHPRPFRGLATHVAAPFDSPPLTFADTPAKPSTEIEGYELERYELNTYSAGAKVWVRSRYSRM
jgi:hypothetical protein